jgi:hypothetical protein
MAGCVAVPIPVQPRVLAGQAFTDSELDFLQPGTTKRKDAIRHFGAPTIWLTRQKIMVYGLRKTESAGVFWFTGAGGGGIGGLVEGETREAIFLLLDDDDTVMQWGRAALSRGETWLSAATEWSRSAGFAVDAPRDRFVEEPPAAGGGLVYFYRPRDYQHFLPPLPPAKKLAAGVATYVDVVLDDELVTQLRWQSYAAIRVSEGTRNFVVNPDTDDVTNTSLYRSRSIRIGVEPGAVMFVEVGVMAGKGTIEPVLAQHSYTEAIAAITELRETW